MVIVYILIAIGLIALGYYWVRYERAKIAEEVADKVEPDLNDLFADNNLAGEITLQEKNDMTNSQDKLKDIDHDDLSYLPKTEAKMPQEQLVVEEVMEEAEMAMEAPIREMDTPKQGGFFQKIADFFRGKPRENITVYSDDGNLMRPASVETVALILKAAPDQPYTFKEVLAVAHELDLRVENGGFIQLLTTTHYGDEPMYSIAHFIGDGIFDENLVRYQLEETTPALLFFSKIPGPDPDISTIEQLLAGIHHFSTALGGTILNANQQPMNNDDLIALFHKINKLDNEEWERAYEYYEQRNR